MMMTKRDVGLRFACLAVCHLLQCSLGQIQDVSNCPCDLTGNVCDINCCCDPDCTAADTEIFTCLPNSYVLDDKLCFDQNVFLYENGPVRSGDSKGLFCIYFDNEESRNYYTNPTLVTTEAEFLKYAAQYRKFSFQPTVPSITPGNFSNYYKSGDPIYVVFPNQAFSYLGLPTSLSSTPTCTDSNPAAFMSDKTNQCSRTLTSLAADCQTNVALQASTFYEGFRIVKDPFLLAAFNSTTSVEDPVLGSLDLSAVTELYNNDFTLAFELEPVNPLQCIQNGVAGPCAFTTPPATPTWDGTTCSSTLVQVNYRFSTSGKFGIENATVSFVFDDVTTSSLTQTFTTTFSTVSSSSGQPVLRSGNPGYDVGQPIIAGVLNITNADGEKILLTEDRGQQLALVRSSVNGDCLTDAGQRRETVVFGQDMRTGCFIQVTSSTPSDFCQLLQQAIINAIEGYAVPTYDPTFRAYPKNNRYVAMFGNSEVQKTGDWVEVLFKNRPPPPTTLGTQCFLSLGADIQILYANVGALPNPQPKIIGVAYVYQAPQEVQYQCSGPFCQPGSADLSQRIEISSSVTFVDVSEAPKGVEAVYPTFAVRLPYDFFYPFLNSGSRNIHTDAGNWLCVLGIVICVLERQFHWL